MSIPGSGKRSIKYIKGEGEKRIRKRTRRTLVDGGSNEQEKEPGDRKKRTVVYVPINYVQYVQVRLKIILYY